MLLLQEPVRSMSSTDQLCGKDAVFVQRLLRAVRTTPDGTTVIERLLANEKYTPWLTMHVAGGDGTFWDDTR